MVTTGYKVSKIVRPSLTHRTIHQALKFSVKGSIPELESPVHTQAWHQRKLINSFEVHPVNIKHILAVVEIGNTQVDFEVGVFTQVETFRQAEVQPVIIGQTTLVEFAKDQFYIFGIGLGYVGVDSTRKIWFGTVITCCLRKRKT